MSFASFAKRSYRFVRRHLGPAPQTDDFPIDAWTDPTYEEWLNQQVPTGAELAEQRERARAFEYQPSFSFIVPLYKTPLDYLDVMARSVLEQTYPNLQLVLVNASPEISELRNAVKRLAEEDSRVSVVTLDGNYGITENTNQGISSATGDFCCFLDHDDYIDRNLLFEYVLALNSDPDIDVLYCDEDLVLYDEQSETFHHQNPFIKPAFSPELLLCRNYIVHLMTIRRSIINQMPTPDKRFDGSQDYNMVLYATSAARKVRNIQKVMYHWRISETSTATNPDSKPYSLRSCRLAIANQIERQKCDASIVGSGLYLVHNLWFNLHDKPKVSLIVDTVDRNRSAELFLEMFSQNNAYPHCEIILLSNKDQPTLSKEEPYIWVKSEGPLFARYNAGAQRSTGEYLIFLDSDSLFISANPIEQLIGMCEREGVGIASPKVLYRNGRNKQLGAAITSERIMPLYRGYEDDFPAYQCNLRTFQNVSAVGIQGLTVASTLFGQIGGFDERYKSEIGTADFCKKVTTANKRIVATPTVKLEENEKCPEKPYAKDNAPDYLDSDLAMFDTAWPNARIQGDPFLNRNLDQASSYCQIPKPQQV